MKTIPVEKLEDHQTIIEQLSEQGYVVIQGLLNPAELEEIRQVVEDLFAKERESPFDPGDGPSREGDEAIEAFLAESYTISKEELARLMRLIRYERHRNHDTPWPIPPNQVVKMFMHLPEFFDLGKTQVVRNLPGKHEIFGRLVENPQVLKLARAVLGADCVLSDISVNSIGPHTEGAAWHVDAPLGQLPEPLPEYPLTLQNVWMLDDFTAENGATRVIPASHKRRKRPAWAGGAMEDEVTLTAPAGSMAVWLSNTWHRVGPNSTNFPRRAILCYYSRSWIKPFSDYRTSIPAAILKNYSPTLRYLLGFSANGIVRA
ncbi:MAG: phytanoyl-CoA dioxygenase family protein [Terriglobia bacterium]